MSTIRKPIVHSLRAWAGAVLLQVTVSLTVALACLALLVLCTSTPARAAAAIDQPPPAAAPYRAELLRAAHGAWGLQAPVAALAAQVHAESAWRADAVSRVGAQGMAQFMPATATWWCGLHGLAPADCQPRNPTWALRAMAGYDAWLHARLAPAGAEPDRLWAMLRAYNGGLGHWQAEAAQAGSHGRREVDAACGRARRAAVHCAENLAYPRRVLVDLQPRYSAWGRTVRVTP